MSRPGEAKSVLLIKLSKTSGQAWLLRGGSIIVFNGIQWFRDHSQSWSGKCQSKGHWLISPMETTPNHHQTASAPPVSLLQMHELWHIHESNLHQHHVPIGSQTPFVCLVPSTTANSENLHTFPLCHSKGLRTRKQSKFVSNWERRLSNKMELHGHMAIAASRVRAL